MVHRVNQSHGQVRFTPGDVPAMMQTRPQRREHTGEQVTKFRISSGTEVELGPMARDLLFMLRTLQSLTRAEGQSLREALDVEPGVIGVLSVIWLNPGISQNDLAATVALKKSAVTKVVTGLESRGLLSRQRVSADRRMNALTLTTEGHALIARMREMTQSWNDRMFADVAPDDRETFFRVLETLVAGYAAPGGGV